MVRVLTIMLWIWCVCAEAQFTFTDQPYMVKEGNAETPVPYPQTIPSVAFYWIASDLTTNVAMTTWVDRIQGSTWLNGDSERCPTNTADGLFFGPKQYNQFLTNVGVQLGGTVNTASNTHWVIYKQPFIESTTEVFLRGGWKAILATMGDMSKAVAPSRIGHGSGTLAWAGGIITNAIIDFTAIWTNSTLGYSFTNGVLVGSHSGGVGGIDNSCGWTNLAKAVNTSVTNFTGYVWEIAIFTNALDGITISNLHWYATNTYGFSP